MRSTYKRIGDYIRLVDVRNRELSVETLLGLSISKQFIPSVANIVGTNMSNYKIIKKNQFACSLMQVRRDKKMPVALLQDFDEAIISQAYPVFEIIDEKLLKPEYLMMWFSRSEFDRQACFLAVGGVRGSLEWDDFCDMTLPIPSIAKQEEIVDEYNTIINRIKLNEELNGKLEETAQAIYKEWFVDFEFPMSREYAESIGMPELEGKAYKANGGELIYNEELEQEIPVGWESVKLNDFIDSSIGGDWGKSEAIQNYSYEVLCIRGADLPLFKVGDYKEIPHRFIQKKNSFKIIDENQIVVELSGGSPIQSTGRTIIVTKSHLENVTLPFICSNFCKVLTFNNDVFSKYIFSFFTYLYNIDYLFMYENSTIGIKNFNLSSFLEEEQLVKPVLGIILIFNNLFMSLNNNILVTQRETIALRNLKKLLLSKIAKVED